MIDLHSHVLPGIDDGPSDVMDSLAMARVAALAGTTVMAATPHVRRDHPAVRPLEIADRVAELRAEVRRLGIGLRLVTGGEVALEDALERDTGELRAVTIAGNGRDLLVETPHGPLPADFEDRVEAVARRGFRVLLAHPEVSRELQKEPRRLEALAAAGTLLQITASALAGPARSRTTRLALLAVREGWAHVIASDGHRADWRPPSLGEGLAAARRALPDAGRALDWMVGAAPAAILAGVALPPRPGPGAAPARPGTFG